MIWSRGLRNPWRDSFDPVTGDLWIADVGGELYEEVDRVTLAEARGADFGWPGCEGTHASPGPGSCPDTGSLAPVIAYAPVNGPGPDAAVTGGFVYRGADQPALAGRYLFGDYVTGHIWSVPADFDDPRDEALPPPLDTDLLITSFGRDGRGELYVLHRGSAEPRTGELYLIVEG
jgi:glucose/arabinose dehydrogenase